jgi:hypothetical protein
VMLLRMSRRPLHSMCSSGVSTPAIEDEENARHCWPDLATYLGPRLSNYFKQRPVDGTWEKGNEG